MNLVLVCGIHWNMLSVHLSSFMYPLDYTDHKLTDSNIGYKMLQKAGWSEGEGLGSKEDGIKAPINM